MTTPAPKIEAAIHGAQVASCAHLTVKYKPVENANRTYSSRWVCNDCGHEFVSKALADYLQADAVSRAESEVRKLKEKLNKNHTLALENYAQLTKERDRAEAALARMGQAVTDATYAAMYAASSWLDSTSNDDHRWVSLEGRIKRWKAEAEETLKLGYVPGWGTDGFPWNKDDNALLASRREEPGKEKG